VKAESEEKDSEIVRIRHAVEQAQTNKAEQD
jgi:hypothetical protein